MPEGWFADSKAEDANYEVGSSSSSDGEDANDPEHIQLMRSAQQKQPHSQQHRTGKLTQRKPKKIRSTAAVSGSSETQLDTAALERAQELVDRVRSGKYTAHAAMAPVIKIALVNLEARARTDSTFAKHFQKCIYIAAYVDGSYKSF
eukprot:SAG31_NODE_840_length_11596_cov_3.056623_8_plen_147_part_00